MRALTIQQPWAGAIAYGAKRVENRTWAAPGRMLGEPLVIHAGKQHDWDARPPIGQSWPARELPWLTRGAVIAVALLADCHDGAMEQGECSEWASRWQWHWVLASVRPLAEPVPCRGLLGLWKLPDEVEKAVREQLEASRG